MTRTALITGGSRGIGRALADALSADGLNVLTPTRDELDLADCDAVELWCEAHAQDGVDVLINNAGINPIASLSELTLAEWRRTLDVDLTAPFLLTRTFGTAMAERGWGRIVNVGSVYSSVSRAGRGAYASAKHGLAALTKTAAIEFSSRQVLVNAVCPGFVATDLTYANNDPATIALLETQIPVGRLGGVNEVAELVRWLCSDANTYVSGQLIAVDGGFLAA
jgi:3-oxoacyl-[acyl-carrier protein] reductase